MSGTPAYHGWTHRPKEQGGTDPIDFPSVSYRNPVVKYAMGGPEWKTAAMFTTLGVTATVDTASPFGGYIEINGDGKYFVVGMPLGPKGSTWAIAMGYRTATDGGKLVFDWQTTPVDGLFGGATEYPESVEGPEDQTPPGTTYYVDNNSNSFHQDFYSASPADFFTPSYAAIQINGDDGEMLSADGTASTRPVDGLGQRLMNGGGDGSVMWWLRVRVSGHNASSSGFKARIYYLAVKRVENSYGFDIF